MNVSKTGSNSGFNLEEFERRLRTAGAAPSGVEDPLEELTRLVNTMAAERPPREDKVVSLAQARLERAEPQPPAVAPPPSMETPLAADAGQEFAEEGETPDEPELPFPPSLRAERPPAANPQAPANPFGLRPALDESPAARHGGAAVAQAVEHGFEFEDNAPTADRRPRSWYLKMGGVSGMALIMLAGAVTMKIGGVSGPKSPPLILAADSPNKVAPPSESAVQSPGDTGALLTKDSTSATPVKLVTNQEQPVDINAHVASAASSPIAPTSDTPIVAPSDNFGSPAPAIAPTPGGTTRIKTVSVRPDGSLISVDSTPVTPAPAPVASSASAPTPLPTPALRKSDTASASNPQPATPSLDLPPPKPSAKSAARVQVAKTDTTAPAESAGAPLQLTPPGPTPVEKPQKLPTKLAPPVQAADAEDAQAPLAPVATGGAGGEWAVQLAAPHSEADAQAAIARLQTKYGADLGGTALGVHKADVNGVTIYRVRASGFSKADAVALCSRLKGSGGDCFVARN